MVNVRTDLACEANELYKESNNKEPDGIKVEEKIEDDTKITIVKVLDKYGAEKIGKPIGTYITLDIPEYTAYDADGNCGGKCYLTKGERFPATQHSGSYYVKSTEDENN